MKRSCSMALSNSDYIAFTTTVCIAFLCLFDSYQVNCFECGQVKLVRSLTVGGKKVLKYEWPFIAAFYQLNPTMYICGGTLISDRHVLTAAHCINKTLSPSDMKVRLGAYNLSMENEIGSVERYVNEIFIHHDWNPNNDKYDADVAILVLSENVTFSNYIQPVCLPANDVKIISDTISVRGRVVGWGTAENETELTPRQIETEASNSSYCYREDPGLIRSPSTRSFCARTKEETLTQEYSGGGFFVESAWSWEQHGIVSAIWTNETGHPSVNSFGIYTNVKSFKRWIVNTVEQSDSELNETSIKINLNCNYGYLGPFGYGCQLNGFDFRNEQTEIGLISGTHFFDNEADDVQALDFESGFLLTLPKGIGKTFKNLRNLKVGLKNSSTSLSYLERSSLQDMKKLRSLIVLDNNIETLDEYCLWDLANLEVFHLINNRVTYLDEKSFVRNERLVEVNLSGNRLENLPNNLFKNNSLLEKIHLQHNFLTTIDEDIFDKNLNLKTLRVFSNKLNALPSKLLEKNTLLEYIDLENNSLTTIDERTFEMNVNLKQVDLSSNKLNFLPGRLFQHNLLLMVVFLEGNLLKSIDERMFTTNAELRVLELSSNRLESLPRNAFQNNHLLADLQLFGNVIETIDEDIFKNNTNLKSLSLTSNPLPRNVNFFKYNVQLNVLLLANLSLDTIDESIFQTNRALHLVDLSANRLTSLPNTLFENNLFLEWLNLSNNSLTKIDEQIFQRNVLLRKVVLSSNQLKYLPQNFFKNNPLLEEIYLGNNFLRAIYIDFTALTYIKVIALDENICVNAVYANDSTRKSLNQFRNLIEFQSLLNANCSSSDNLIR